MRHAYQDAAVLTHGCAAGPGRPREDVFGAAGIAEHPSAMRIVTLPGVFRPHSDTWLLAAHLRDQLRPGAAVLDVCTGSGALAVTAARHGAGAVTAIDVSRRAVLTARINARLNGVRVRALRGDLLAPVAGERFDVIVSNPPYVPAEDDALPTRGPRRAWDAGTDGRALLDRVCAAAPAHLRPGGILLLVHSSVCGLDPTVEHLEAAGLDVDVLERRPGPFGPLLSARAPVLEARGVLAPGQREEDMLVVRAAA
jgi:release factor glutamine methyltransferase